MENKHFGECSSFSSFGEDNERPLKKARYVWQLKGKHHLKKSKSQNKQIYKDKGSICSDNKKNNNANYKKCCVDEMLARSESLLEYENSNSKTCNIDRSISDEIPVTLVIQKNNEEYLQKWQARQVAKSFVDNTINSILEQWKLAPFDASDFVENCETDGQVLDKGILMAIKSHGLQSNLLNPTSCNNKIIYDQINTKANNDDSVSFIKPQQLNESKVDNFENVHCENNIRNDVSNLEESDANDFLNAAVSVAIQKKGLSSYNYG